MWLPALIVSLLPGLVPVTAHAVGSRTGDPAAKKPAAKKPAAKKPTAKKPAAKRATDDASAAKDFGALEEPALREALGAMGLPLRLSAKEHAQLRAVVAKLRSDDQGKAQGAWKKLLGLRQQGKQLDPSAALLGMVMREAYLDASADLADMAARVAYYNELKQALRDELQRTREGLAELLESGATSFELEATIVRTSYVEGGHPVLGHSTIELTAEQAQDHIELLETRLSAIGDDAQLANIDLQDALQKQQQTLQTMSNMAKALHDTQKAVICSITGNC